MHDKSVPDLKSFFKESSVSPQLKDILVSSELIKTSIKELSYYSSAGADGLPASLFKECTSELCLPLKLFFFQIFK